MRWGYHDHMLCFTAVLPELFAFVELKLYCNYHQGIAANEDSNYWTQMTTVIRQEIQEYRSELDALTMKRMQMERKLKQVIIYSV